MNSREALFSKEALQQDYAHLDTFRLLMDQYIDIMLNHRQSGHPGGPRGKVHQMVALMATGAMRWDVRDPLLPLADRFVLTAGHCIPLVYAALAVVNHAMQLRYQWTGDEKYKIKGGAENILSPDDLLTLRYHDGLPGHAEFAGKSLFIKFNTGPSGHGAPAAAGIAMALKHAGCADVNVFEMEGEGGHTAGAHHETKNSAYGLGLSNLIYMMDWNNFGIDPTPHSAVVYGTPQSWFESYGFKVDGTDHGCDFEGVVPALFDNVFGENPAHAPRCVWFKTTKGRGYGVTGYASHGVPHARNHELFWKAREEFMSAYGVTFAGYGEGDPGAKATEQAASHINTVKEAMAGDKRFVEWLSDRLVAIGDSVPREKPSKVVVDMGKDLLQDDPVFTDYLNYPPELFAKPGAKAPNRMGFRKFGAWINAYSLEKYGRPLVLAMSADLAGSTNIAGFMEDFEGKKGTGWYDRDKNTGGALLPQMITEFANSGICAGIAATNFASDPVHKFAGYVSAHSTYGSFSYLGYGLMRLLSQMAQDAETKLGKVIWVAGHSGPETAEDSRTHFGIFAPGATQLFPAGQVINLYPWEHNDVAPAIGAALATDVPIIVVHLTRPPVEIPDREALGIAPYMMAAKGAYVMREFDERPRAGTLLVQGTSVVSNTVKLLPWLNSEGPNMKVVCCVSYELFQLQTDEYKNSVLPKNEWQNSLVATTAARRTMSDWIWSQETAEYTLSSDFDNRWRTGGTVDEVIAEAHLDVESIKQGILRFAGR